MIRANRNNLLRKDLRDVWKMTNEQWGELLKLAFSSSWVDYHVTGDPVSQAQYVYLSLINRAINGFGVELLWTVDENTWYINQGDSDAVTIISSEGKLYIGAWSDALEKLVNTKRSN
jgi:hypothetical protein